MLTYERILKWAVSVYTLPETKDQTVEETVTSSVHVMEGMKLRTVEDKAIDNDSKILTLQKKLYIHYEGGTKTVSCSCITFNIIFR